jgi:hypothetical protein
LATNLWLRSLHGVSTAAARALAPVSGHGVRSGGEVVDPYSDPHMVVLRLADLDLVDHPIVRRIHDLEPCGRKP